MIEMACVQMSILYMLRLYDDCALSIGIATNRKLRRKPRRAERYSNNANIIHFVPRRWRGDADVSRLMTRSGIWRNSVLLSSFGLMHH